MTDRENSRNTPEPSRKPVFFDPEEAFRKGKRQIFGSPGPDDAAEAQRMAAEREAESAAEGKEDDIRR